MTARGWSARIAFVLASLPGSALAADYYVDNQDPAAADSNDGSMGAPWLTLDQCASTLGAGDRCIVKSTGGSYAGFSQNASGSPGSAIVYLAEPGEEQPRITSSVDVGGSSHVRIEGFWFDGVSISGDDCAFISIVDNLIAKSNTGIAGLDNCDDVLISGNEFEGITNDAVRQFGQRWTIRNNVVSGEVDADDDHFDFWQSWCNEGSSGNEPGDYTLIENNVYSDVAGPNVHFVLFHQTTLCGSNEGTTFIIWHNKVRFIGSGPVGFDNDDGAPGFEGVAVYNNVFGESGEGSHPTWRDYAAVVDDAPGSAFFINNVLYDAVDPDGAQAAYPPSIPTHCTLAYDPDNMISVGGSLEMSMGSIVNEDPLFVDYANDNFAPTPDQSPLIDAGCPLTAVAESDAGAGNELVVDAPWFFSPGWGDAQPDCIAVGDVTNVACVESIDYDTGTLTLDGPVDRGGGDSVSLYSDSDGTVVLYGEAPEIGAVELSGACRDVTCMPQDDCHAAGVCDAETGECTNPSLPDGTSCPDGVCMGGECMGGDGDPDTGGSETGGDSTQGDGGSGSTPGDTTDDETSGTGGASDGAGTGGADDAEDGCSCRTKTGPPGLALLLLFVGLGVVRRRR